MSFLKKKSILHIKRLQTSVPTGHFSDLVKIKAFLLFFLIYLFCFKTEEIYYWAIGNQSYFPSKKRKQKGKEGVSCN